MAGSGAILLTVGCWSLFGQKHLASRPLAGSGCHVGLTRETTWTSRRDHSVNTRTQIPLLSLVLRDGKVFYIMLTIFDSAIALANLSNILTFYLCGPFLRGALSTFASSISVTMMSRIMLNLHQNADVGIYSNVKTTSTMQYSDRNYSGCEQTDHIELDTLGSDMFDPSQQNSPVRSTSPLVEVKCHLVSNKNHAFGGKIQI
ncbi:hypothetical protein BDQ17DRAFT_1411320 [Cyathus striatus]|nr:hypothetical protein BDQ17DRAFT_1411320 [Cyathus striatus]